MQFADQAELKASGRNFDCTKCTEQTMQKRRCRSDRFDYTEADDASVFPIYINKGGNLYGFCPAKSMWDKEVIQLYNCLVVAAESGTMLKSGAIEDQPVDWLELCGWFLPLYDNIKWALRFKSILGGDSKDGNHRKSTKNISGNRLSGGGKNNRNPIR